MFIGLSQLRAQTSTARWHHAVFFMAANAAFITWVSAILSSKDWPHLAYAVLISTLAAFVNFLWSGMVKRETDWIGFYTSSLKEIEARLGKPLALSSVYRMLARHGWRKLAPDTRHPDGDPQAREDWKKSARWSKSSPASFGLTTIRSMSARMQRIASSCVSSSAKPSMSCATAAR